MRIKIVTLLLFGLVAGCGANGNNTPDGAGGNSGSDGGGGGGGGGGGCADQCTAGASQCVDSGNQETCMPLNGCLQWVKTACSAAQVCKAGDMGGGACVTGVPCTCPSGFSCDNNGVCQGGDPTKIPIDVKTINVAGTITLNGAAPTTNPSCDPDPTVAKATVQLRDTARGYLFQLPVQCSSSTFAWSGVIFPGTYTVTVSGDTDYASLPNEAYVANPALSVAADAMNVALDVKTVSVGGTVTLNAAVPAILDANCAAAPNDAMAIVHLRDATDGYSFDLDVPCSSATFAWGGTIFPGTYAVSVSGVSGMSSLPLPSFVTNSALSITGNMTSQVLAVTTQNVSGTVTLNGVAPTVTASCTAASGGSKATVHLSDAKDGYAFDVPIPCSAADFSWAGDVYPGTYTITVAGQAQYSNVPTQAFVGKTAVAVNANLTGQTLAIRTQNVSGTVTLNGQTPTATATCTAQPTANQVTVTLRDKTNGYSFPILVPCSSATLAWSGVVYPGNYAVLVVGANSTYSTLPTQAYLAQASLVVNGDVANNALDVKTINAGGTVTLNGALPTTSTGCNNASTTAKAMVTLSDTSDGYSFSLPVPCSSSTFAFSGSIYPGTYRVSVAGSQSNSNVPSQSYLTNASLVAASDVTGQILDVKTRNVGGTVTLNGTAPSTSTSCNPSPTATKANLVFSDSSDGYSFTIPVACSAASFSFAGVVYPGVYRISVAGDSGYSNLPTQSFLGTSGLSVQ